MVMTNSAEHNVQFVSSNVVSYESFQYQLTKLKPRLPTMTKCAVVSCSSSSWVVTSRGTCSELCASMMPWTYDIIMFNVRSKTERVASFVLDWIEQGLTSPTTQYRLSGRQFYRSKDPTNSIKVLKEKLASHSTEEAQNPPGTSHHVTSEPLKKKNPITVGQAQRDKAPHSRLACTSPV